MADNFTQIKSLARSAVELTRQNKQQRRFDVYLDRFEYLAKELIAKQFHPENAQRLYPMVCNYANLLKKIVNLKSVLYKHEAKREWLSGGKTPDEKYSELIEKSNIHIAFQSINKYLNINNTGFMRIMPDLESRTMKYEAVPSENMVVLRRPDSPYEVDAVLHHIILDDINKFWYYWDRERHFRVDESLETITEEGKNEYIDPNTKKGIIPYVPAWVFQPLANSFWCETHNDDLYNVTLQINVHLTHLNNLLKSSCYKQWVFTGMLANDIKNMYGQVTDGMNPIALTGENAAANTFEMTGDIMAVMNVIHDLISQVCDQHGISFSSQSTSAQKQSAPALTIEKEAMDDLREEQEPRLRECEKLVAFASVIIANKEFASGIDVAGQFRLTFGHNSKVLTPEDTAAEDWQMEHGLKPVTDLYRELNPGVLDDNAAAKAIRDNLAKNKELSAQDAGQAELAGAFEARMASGSVGADDGTGSEPIPPEGPRGAQQRPSAPGKAA